MRYAPIWILSFFPFGLFGQITVTNIQTPKELVQNIFKRQNITISNVKYNSNLISSNSSQQNVSFFDAKGTNFPISSGVLLTTGKGSGAVGPNNSSSQTNGGTPNVGNDPHLSALANGTVTNGAVLEFDFVPKGDFVSFRYIFGSDEYPEFSPSLHNDAFGFFLWGPGISGPYVLSGYPLGGTNLALIPGSSTAVNINTVGPANNAQFYVSNSNGVAYGNAVQYDGTTKILPVRIPVQCGQTYHIKLGICNVSNETNDSGVFLEAGSFSSDVIEMATETIAGDSSVYEGCTKAKLIFKRPFAPLGAKVTLKYKTNGTATNGTDFTSLIGPIIFNVGDDTGSLTVDPINDGLAEVPEQLIVSTYFPNQCGDTVITNHSIWIEDKPHLNILVKDTILTCKSDSIMIEATPVGGIGNVSLSWSTGSTGSPVYVPASQIGNTTYIVTMSDQCKNSYTNTLTVSVLQKLKIDSLTAGPSTCEPTGWVSAMVSGTTGVPLYTWNGPGANNTNQIDATVWEKLSSGWYYFTVKDDLCLEYDSVFVDILKPPKAQFSVDPAIGCGPLQVSMTNSSQNTDRYNWNFGNGQELNINSTESQSQTYNVSSTIRLIAYQGTLCSDTTYNSVFVAICACKDPNALNFNPLAQFDDGSCQYPGPTVVAPNVFTPNGDGVNETFNLIVTYAKSIHLVILNRWGTKMFDTESINSALIGPQWNGPAWNGETDFGTPVSEGVYFYKYHVEGLNGELLEGHGFMELIR